MCARVVLLTTVTVPPTFTAALPLAPALRPKVLKSSLFTAVTARPNIVTVVAVLVRFLVMKSVTSAGNTLPGTLVRPINVPAKSLAHIVGSGQQSMVASGRPAADWNDVARAAVFQRDRGSVDDMNEVSAAIDEPADAGAAAIGIVDFLSLREPVAERNVISWVWGSTASRDRTKARCHCRCWAAAWPEA